MSKINSISEPGLKPEWQTLIERKVNSIRFGTIQVVIHEGKVTQVEVTEKTRFANTRVHELSAAS